MKKSSNIRASILAGLLTMSLTHAAHGHESELLSLTAEHFSQTATVQENAVQGTITVSTEKGFVERHGPLRTVWDDAYLRAVLNKNTGQKSFTVEVSFTYSGAHREYQGAVFNEDGVPRTVAVGAHRSESVNCPTGECTFTEILDFPVDEPMLRSLAAGGAGAPRLWTFKIIGPPKKDYQGRLSSAEIAGLLARVDEESGGVRTLDARGQPVAEIARDLGVAGIAIAATEETPPRSGLLLTAVNRGSVGQKAGLLVGDMVYELDGHPVESPGELNQAVLRSRSKATVAIKLYRGQEKLSVSATF